MLQHDHRDLRHQDRHVLPDRLERHRAERGASLQDQRRADRDPRRRLRPEPVPALLGRRHRQADRADEEHGPQHDPARGPHHAGRLLPADGPGRHPGQRRVPVLRRLGGRRQPAPRRSRTSCRTRRRPSGTNLRNHPSVFSFQWSDNQPTSQQESVSIAGFAAADFYPQTPLIASAEYKSTTTLGAAGEKEGPYDWVPPDYWYDTTHLGSDCTVTNAGGRLGLRQRGERRRHHPDHGLAQPVHVRQRPVATCGRTPRPTSTTPTTSRAASPATRSARCATSTPPCPAGTASGRAWPSTSRRRRPRTTRTPGPSSRRSSTTPTTPRCRPPGPSTGR